MHYPADTDVTIKYKEKTSKICFLLKLKLSKGDNIKI